MADKKIRFGILGCGVIAPTHAGALKQLAGDAELVAVADVVPARAAELGGRFGVTKIYPSDDALIADPDVDAVIVTTPSGLHAQSTVKALRGGKHVVVEKPMDITLAACDAMIAAERESGNVLTVISQHRFDHATLAVRDAIESGRLGKIVLVEMSVRWWRAQTYYDSGDWRGTWAMDGGGALMNQGVHTVDLMRWLAGPVKSLYARCTTAAHERIEVEDVATAQLQFESGAVGTLLASTACYSGLPAMIGIYGTLGSAVIEGDRLKMMKFKDGTSVTAEAASGHAASVASGGTASVKNEAEARTAAADPGAVWGDAHREQLRDFIHAIRTGAKPVIDGTEARKAVEIILAVYESSRTGQVVTL